MADRPAPTSAGTARTPSRARNAGRPGCRELVALLRFPLSASRGPAPRLIQCQPMIPCQPSCSAFPKGHSRLLFGSSLRLLDRCRQGGSSRTEGSAGPGAARAGLSPGGPLARAGRTRTFTSRWRWPTGPSGRRRCAWAVFLRRCFTAEHRPDEHEPVLGVLDGVDVWGASAD